MAPAATTVSPDATDATDATDEVAVDAWSSIEGGAPARSGGSPRLSRRALFEAGAVGATAWTLNGVQYQEAAYYGGDGSAPPAAVSTERASHATGPVYLLHGESDGIVGVDRTQAFADALAAAGADVDVELVPGADHGYDGYGSPALSALGLATAARLEAWLERKT